MQRKNKGPVIQELHSVSEYFSLSFFCYTNYLNFFTLCANKSQRTNFNSLKRFLFSPISLNHYRRQHSSPNLRKSKDIDAVVDDKNKKLAVDTHLIHLIISLTYL